MFKNILVLIVLLLGSIVFAQEIPAGKAFELSCHQKAGSTGAVLLEASFRPVAAGRDDVLGVINIAGTAKLSVNNWGIEKTVMIPLAGAYLPNDELTGAEEFAEFHPVNANDEDANLKRLIFHVSFNSSQAADSWVFNLADADFAETALECIRN